MARGDRYGRRRRAALLVAAAAPVVLAAVASPGCRTATQVTVELRTVGVLSCAAVKGVAIVVARTAAEAEEKMRDSTLSAEVPRGECGPDGRALGTLAITPSGSTGAIIVRARVSDAPEASCVPPDYKGCIVARRAFSFIDHAALVMPIGLEAACADVPCDVLTSCRTGTCISSLAECSEASSRCESAAEPEVAPDGTTLLPDGAVADAALADASMADGGTPDASADAPADAALDAPPDVDPALFGNQCPSQPAVDCNAQVPAKTCCYMGSYFCQEECTMGYYVFSCLGRKPCNAGSFCCGLPNGAPDPKGSSCDTTGGLICAQNGSHYICTTDADCPSTLPRCNGIYYNVGIGTVKECSLN